MRAAAVLLALVAAAIWAAPAAAAPPTPAEVELARTYAPVLELKDQPRPCEAGEPYEPTDIDLLMGNDEIALRGPWDTTNIVSVAPRAAELGRGLFGYHLDFPGDPLRPGCTYEQWSIRLRAQAPPTAYARAVTQPGPPGRLALQYWFFYVFNDWNNTHEGDWEMIQLNFDADTPEAALARGRPRSATASTPAPSAPTGATRSSRSSAAPTRSSTRPPAPTPTSSTRRST